MLNLKEDILKNAVNQTVDDSYIYFNSIYFPTMEVSGDQQLSGSSKFFSSSSISFFVFNITEKHIQVWNGMRVSK